jgi:hypothetical protein
MDPNAPRVEVTLHESHYKFVILPTLGNLKMIMDGDLNTMKLLMDNVPLTMAFLSTTYNFDGECPIWKGLDWECLLIGLFNCKVCFQSVICICDRKAFFAPFCNSDNISILIEVSIKIWAIYGYKNKGSLGKETFMETLVLFYAYFIFQSSRCEH